MYEKGIVVKTLKEIDKEVIDEPWFGGVYAFINLLENKVYVGESKDLEERMYTHCKAIFSDKQIDSTYKASNKNLITAPQKQFCLTVFAQFDKKCEKKCEKKIPIPKKNRYWVALETVIMYLFVETGFGLYNGSGDGKIRDNLGKKRAFLLENTDIEKTRQNTVKFLNKYTLWETSVYKGYKQDKIEMRGDRAEMSDFPLYLNMVAGGLDRRDQTISGFSFVVKIYAVPVVEIIG